MELPSSWELNADDTGGIQGSTDDPQQLPPFLRQHAEETLKKAKATYSRRRETFIADSKAHMDYCLKAVGHTLRQALEKRNTTAFWTCYWTAVEDATLAFTQDDHHFDDIKKFRGRGDHPVQLVKQKVPRVNQDGSGVTLHTPGWLAGLQHQANRCKFVVDNLAIIAKRK